MWTIRDGTTGNEIVQVTLSPDGRHAGAVTGLNFTLRADANSVGTGDGTADATMTFRGTLTDVNAALNRMP